MATGVIALAVYVATLTPGVTWSDYAEEQHAAATLGIMHPTGYPTYTLLGWLFTFVPIGSMAYRVNLASAVYVSGALAIGTLILRRFGVRASVAVAAMLTVGFVPTVWLTATRPETHTLHMLFVALMLHRLALWAETQRARDAILLALITGLSLGNHMTTSVVAPVIAVAAAWVGRRTLLRRPWIVAAAGGALLLGISTYLYLPLRARFGGPAWTAPLATWEGFRNWVTGTQFGAQTSVLSAEALSTTAREWRGFLDLVVMDATPVFLVAAVAGAVCLLWSSRVGAVLVGVGVIAVHVHVSINFAHWAVAQTSRYLNAAWLVLGFGAAIAVEHAVRAARRIAGEHANVLAAAAFALPLGLAPKYWTKVDQSANRGAQAMVDTVFNVLPPNAVLITYWDTMTVLRYAQEVDSRRTDVTVSVAGVGAIDQYVETDRPVFFLLMFEEALDGLRDRYTFTRIAAVHVSYGNIDAPHERSVFHADPIARSP